jgi:hypothetical protein
MLQVAIFYFKVSEFLWGNLLKGRQVKVILWRKPGTLGQLKAHELNIVPG